MATDPNPQAAGGATATPAAAGARMVPAELYRTLFHIAWLAILLGFAIEALLLIAAAGFGTLGPAPALVAELLQKVSWSFLVCLGLGFGNAVAKHRPGLVGLSGVLAGPIAFGVARALHKSAAAALGMATGGGPSPLLIAAVKAAQYGVFGWLVAGISKRAAPRLTAHAMVGLVTGAVFGGIIVVLTVTASNAPLATPDLLARGINEVLFPIGCALVLWTSDALAQARQ